MDSYRVPKADSQSLFAIGVSSPDTIPESLSTAYVGITRFSKLTVDAVLSLWAVDRDIPSKRVSFFERSEPVIFFTRFTSLEGSFMRFFGFIVLGSFYSVQLNKYVTSLPWRCQARPEPFYALRQRNSSLVETDQLEA
mmetsp:Transcript_24984/g.34953  ORF Transcript_24984/g.34953 Transcript_24984/m.34953 type:complete len:138 (-) Transcript_24984:46-459(-)